MQSNRSRLMLVALFGVLALSAVTAVAAQAADAPSWAAELAVLVWQLGVFLTVACRPWLAWPAGRYPRQAETRPPAPGYSSRRCQPHLCQRDSHPTDNVACLAYKLGARR